MMDDIRGPDSLFLPFGKLLVAFPFLYAVASCNTIDPSQLPYFYFSPVTPPQLFIFNSIINVLIRIAFKLKKFRPNGVAGDIIGKMHLYYHTEKELQKNLARVC